MKGIERLTEREIEVARVIAVDCLTCKEAALVLHISFRTVEQHRSKIFAKLHITHGIAELARRMALDERNLP